ncbi:hypothetical protein [Campylobacter geochelonis]|uniref:Uncharacterized protein n=1 Tax=Campylobacter geochelonis TaxID=1780362 RepID=A0A128ECB1_9BACT|nr:hypothetical protein [Campylobacter geochelonis]QKF72174.1 hypothetical protein CGEO_1908 [Campylobacter geochelonis]CZE46579.1 Uncharacterised protein [Campylobacter geochelonis]
MKIDDITPNNFDKVFEKMLKDKKKRGVANARIDFENISINDKIKLILFLIFNGNGVENIIYKILFWENDTEIKNYIETKIPKENFKKIKPYKKGAEPGVIFIEQNEINTDFLKSILLRHFNFELAKEPLLNIRVLLFVKMKNQFSILLDIYDDRGCYAYYL